MPRRLKPEQQLELESLFRIVSVIADWYEELVPVQLRGQMTEVMRRAHGAGDLRGLRMAYNDLVEMTNAANVAQRRDLDTRLRARTNTNLEAIHARIARRIGRFRARGRLTSEEQYYLVREHVEFIFGVPGREAEVEQLNAMLHEFEERSAAGGKARSSPTSVDDPSAP